MKLAIPKPYLIEYRSFESPYNNNTYFNNYTPTWSKWKPIKECATVEELTTEFRVFERRKSHLKHRTEYRVVKKDVGDGKQKQTVLDL